MAKAYDSLGASAESTPVGITVAAGPAVVASPTQLGVQQGKSGTYAVQLSKQPSSNVTVTTARASGNSGLSVTGGATLTFTPANWNTAQNVTVTADTSGAGNATFTVSASGYPAVSVTGTEIPPGSTGTPAHVVKIAAALAGAAGMIDVGRCEFDEWGIA